MVASVLAGVSSSGPNPTKVMMGGARKSRKAGRKHGKSHRRSQKQKQSRKQSRKQQQKH